MSKVLVRRVKQNENPQDWHDAENIHCSCSFNFSKRTKPNICLFHKTIRFKNAVIERIIRIINGIQDRRKIAYIDNSSIRYQVIIQAVLLHSQRLHLIRCKRLQCYQGGTGETVKISFGCMTNIVFARAAIKQKSKWKSDGESSEAQMTIVEKTFRFTNDMKPRNKRPILLSETLDALKHMYYIAFLETLYCQL